MEKTTEELRKMSSKIYAELMPVSYEANLPMMIRHVQQERDDKVWSMINHVRKDPDSPFLPYMVTCKKFKNTVISIAINPRDIEVMNKVIHQHIDDHSFLRKQFQKFNTLTKREKEVLVAISKGETNQQIADQWSVSKNTVRTQRNSLYKKLDIKHLANIIKYAEAFDLA